MATTLLGGAGIVVVEASAVWHKQCCKLSTVAFSTRLHIEYAHNFCDDFFLRGKIHFKHARNHFNGTKSMFKHEILTVKSVFTHSLALYCTLAFRPFALSKKNQFATSTETVSRSHLIYRYFCAVWFSNGFPLFIVQHTSKCRHHKTGLFVSFFALTF